MDNPAADSLADTAATARLMESPSSGSHAYINFGSIIRLLFYCFKSSVRGGVGHVSWACPEDMLGREHMCPKCVLRCPKVS